MKWKSRVVWYFVKAQVDWQVFQRWEIWMMRHQDLREVSEKRKQVQVNYHWQDMSLFFWWREFSARCAIPLGIFHQGPSIKDVCTLRGAGGSGKSEQIPTEGGGEWWLAKCGRLLGKKIIATIFVEFTQIIWQYVCI